MKPVKILVMVLCLIGCQTALYAYQGPVAASAEHAPKRKPDYAKNIEKMALKVQELWNVPAMAVTVVKDGKTVYAKGLGRLTTAPDAPQANPYTLFVNASTSKAFTGALMGILVDKGFVKWDDRVIDHLPDFQLYDPWVTQNYLVKDIMNHKTGFQPQALDVVPALGYDRDDLFQMFRLVRPTYGFRSTYAYCNALYTVAARIIEKYTGLTWEQALEEYIFKPLEMNHTTTGKDSYFTAENFAYGYRLRKADGTLQLSPRDDRQDAYDWLQAVSPAAFVMSNAHDMGQWMKMWLADGEYNGQQILTPQTIRNIFKPETICSWDHERVILYAQGWRIEQGVQGKLINHTGLAGGYTAWVVLVPELNLGVSVLMNQGTTTTPEISLARQIIDLYRDVDSDWITTLYNDYMKPAAPRKPKVEEDFVESLENKVYAGLYFKDIFGEAVVYEQNNSLYLDINDVSGPLVHKNGHTFRYRARDESFDVTFQVDTTLGRAQTFTFDFGDDLGPFVRVFK
ncbi:MAG TPA: serine hydrolase [Bacteroidales bacterium]|nr:serine hydrolase [Bacteroidales bacterium]